MDKENLRLPPAIDPVAVGRRELVTHSIEARQLLKEAANVPLALSSQRIGQCPRLFPDQSFS